MRKYIIPLFLSLCPTIAPATTSEECRQFFQANKLCSYPGCGYYPNTFTSAPCIPCPVDTYQNQPPALEDLLLGGNTGTECRTCLWPWQIRTDISSEFYSWIGETGKTSLDDCQLNLTIPAGYELAIDDNIWVYNVRQCLTNTYKPNSASFSLTHGGDTNIPYGITVSAENIPTETQCKKCGNNATHNDDHTNCDCNYGYHIGKDINNTENVGSENCTLITFAVKYNDGENDIADDKIPTMYKLIGPNKSLTLPTVDCNQPSINGIPQFLCMSKTGYNFDNQWTADKKLNVCNPGQCLGEKEAGYAIAVGATATLTDDNMGDVTFTAVWTAKKFKITYDTNNNCPTKTQDCTYDTSCYLKYDNTCDTTGQYISGWQCTSGCSDKTTTHESGDNISTISGGNDMTLTAIWKNCHAGYYCDGDTPNACPAGCTSDEGSDEITDCYLSGETQFCDQNKNCFKIDGLEIKYKN